MCATCGCSSLSPFQPVKIGNTIQFVPEKTETLSLEQEILSKNDHLARENRRWLEERKILTLNLVSSPGSGKTTLLERTLRDLGPEKASVLEGDQETENDAKRIRTTGAKAVQVNTGTGCHLDAAMVREGLKELQPEEGSLLFIENVGNLVCPALFDLGERAKVVILSVTEGEDKPLKYPHLFQASALMLINKIDLLPYVSFTMEACIENARKVNPRIEVLLVSATRGDGLEAWYEWIEKKRANPPLRASAPSPSSASASLAR
jgi:hydrogenase nickel incorporation protein HypB